jgi:hypothetical protein
MKPSASPPSVRSELERLVDLALESVTRSTSTTSGIDHNKTDTERAAERAFLDGLLAALAATTGYEKSEQRLRHEATERYHDRFGRYPSGLRRPSS